MLFLAVFCGFLAENIREHVVEKRREQQFVKSLVQDIKLDLKNLDSLDKGWAIDYNNASKEKDLLAGNDVITNSVPAFNLWDTSTGWDDFVPSDGTIQELKSSGGLRLITKRTVVDCIMAYQRAVDQTKSYNMALTDRQLNTLMRNELFDVITIYNQKGQGKIPLLSTDKTLRNRAFGYISSWQGSFKWLRYFGDQVRNRGMGLLSEIKKQYGIL